MRLNQSEISCQMNQSVGNAVTLLLVALQSSFTEVHCRISTSLLQFSYELAISHGQWRKVRTALSLQTETH